MLTHFRLISKTHFITFKVNLPNSSLSHHVLASVASSKFLGLYVGLNLKFENHFLSLNKKLSSGCYSVRVVASELGKAVAKQAYYALIESQLRYCLPF